MSNTITIKSLIRLVADATDTTEAQICSPQRQPEVCRARHMVAALAYRRAGKTLAQIGGVLGGRDHTTIKSGIRRAAELRRTDREFARIWEEIDAACAGAAEQTPPLRAIIGGLKP